MQALSLQQIRKGKGWPRGARFVLIPPRSHDGKRPTRRQIQVAQALADGLTLREAALALGIKHSTARVHAESYRRRAIRLALASDDAVLHGTMNHAIAIGFRQGWLT